MFRRYRPEGSAVSNVLVIADPRGTTTLIAGGDPSTIVMLPLVPSCTCCTRVERLCDADQRLEQAEYHQYLGYRSAEHGPAESVRVATQKQLLRSSLPNGWAGGRPA